MLRYMRGNHVELRSSEAPCSLERKRIESELRHPVVATHMNMRWLVSVEGDKEEPIRSDPEHRRHTCPPRT